MEFYQQIVDCIMKADRKEAMTLIQQWADEHGYDQLAERILVPALKHFSDQHASWDESPLARGYVAAKIAEETMDLIALQSKTPRPQPTKGPVVIGNTEDDFHALGRRIVSTFLTTAGWRIIDVGNDVTATEFVNEAVAANAPIIGVSAMMYSTAINIRKVREELDRRHLSGTIQLAVGGAVFNLRPELVAEVGGDATAKVATDVPDLFERMISPKPFSKEGEPQ